MFLPLDLPDVTEVTSTHTNSSLNTKLGTTEWGLSLVTMYQLMSSILQCHYRQFGPAYSTAGNIMSLYNSETISGSASLAFSWTPYSFELTLITLRYLSSL